MGEIFFSDGHMVGCIKDSANVFFFRIVVKLRNTTAGNLCE